MSEHATQIALMQQDIKYIKEHQAINKKEADERHAELLAAIKEVADSKAGVWVERVLIWIGSVVGVALIGAWLSLILIK